MLVWDNLNTHLAAGMRRYIADRGWPTVFQLMPYAPDLNPVEGIRSVSTHHRGQPCLRRPR